MDKPNYFDSLKALSDEEFLYEVFQNTINSMSREDQDKFLDLLRKGAQINGKRY